MQIKTSFFCAIVLILILITAVSHATSIGTDLKISNIFPGPHSLTGTSDTNDLNSLLNNHNGTAKATASLTGNLSTESNTAFGFEYVTAKSKSWLLEDIYNDSILGNFYYLSLDYIFELKPGANFPCGTGTSGNISVIVNNLQVADISYQNNASWLWDWDTQSDRVVYSGSSLVNASRSIFLGYLDPGESFSLSYSISTQANGEEHAGAYASSKLNASLLAAPNPVPEPSSIVLVCFGLAGLGILKRKTKA